MYLWLSIIGQVNPSTGSTDLDTILKSYGIAAPVILGMLAGIRVLWKRLQSALDELARVRDVQIEKVVPTLVKNTEQLERSAVVLERVAVMMTQLAAQPGTDPDTWRRLLSALEDTEYRRRRDSES